MQNANAAPARVRGSQLQAIRSRLRRADPLCAECRRQGRLRAATRRQRTTLGIAGDRGAAENFAALAPETVCAGFLFR